MSPAVDIGIDLNGIPIRRRCRSRPRWLTRGSYDRQRIRNWQVVPVIPGRSITQIDPRTGLSCCGWVRLGSIYMEITSGRARSTQVKIDKAARPVLVECQSIVGIDLDAIGWTAIDVRKRAP